MTRLLIVDDEPEITQILHFLLHENFEEIITARNGEEAFSMILADKFDAVLSDVRMPNMTGLDLLAKLRDQGINMPFVIMTGFAEEKILKEALRLGATDIICKPFDSEGISRILLKAIETSTI